MHNLQSEALLSFSTWLPSDDLVGDTLLDPGDVVAGAGASSFRGSADTN
jgi:hypothetical protein